ncbi:MurR/RpiR family transcriptional regulator [Aquamicrobium sp. LC103]|uniref:MurR/RpiR family transcriptional regulator n=1 Tax=Aquamicrobium sp. LC103 TaxID=1120658 RepID=UPI00063E8F65|nr:MurR/RpiR family transcriptional regulator [Aquamicrobium sp. LC103]TKT77560.1 MurR/RpiR family transcriptional regulator [Aquamicrobium sp. LC103]
MGASVAERIAERLEAMPAGERRAAQVLVANYPLLGLKTVAEFSLQAGVSSPTILRFVSRLGFQNYPEFQSALQEELAAQLQSPLSRATDAAGERQDDGTPMVATTIDNIRETFRHLPQSQLQAVLTSLCNPKVRVFLLGGRFSDPIAAYLAAHLTVIRSNVVHLAGQESNWRDRLIDMGKQDIVLLFDIRRYQESLMRFAEKAHGRGAQIILFTDQWLSPIARFSQHVIAGRTAVPSTWDSSAALFVVAETLVAETTRRLGEDAARRIREMELLRQA